MPVSETNPRTVGEPVHLRFAIHVAEQATRLCVGDLSLRVHPDAAHQRQVEHQRAVGRRPGPRCCVLRP